MDLSPSHKKRPPLEILPPARAFYVPPILLPEEALQMLMPAAYQSASVPSTATASIIDTSGMQQKDTTWTKLFVGGLPYHTTDSTLRDHFKVYGEIDEAVVITDRQTGKSRGYGFVIMADRISAERACKEPNPIIDGRKANVNLAILGAKPRGNAVAAAAVAASFPFVRAGYPASLLASNYGLPAAALYQQQAYQQAILPSSSSLASALATQFYEYRQPTLAATAQFPGAHFAQAAFDPYTAYLAQVQAQAQAVQQGQQHAASYAAYLPTASANPTSAAVLNPYAQAESRLQ